MQEVKTMIETMQSLDTSSKNDKKPRGNSRMMMAQTWEALVGAHLCRGKVGENEFLVWESALWELNDIELQTATNHALQHHTGWLTVAQFIKYAKPERPPYHKMIEPTLRIEHSEGQIEKRKALSAKMLKDLDFDNKAKWK